MEPELIQVKYLIHDMGEAFVVKRAVDDKLMPCYWKFHSMQEAQEWIKTDVAKIQRYAQELMRSVEDFEKWEEEVSQ